MWGNFATFALANDLFAIAIVAIFYTDHINFAPLGFSLIPRVAFGIEVQRGIRAWWILIPLGLLTWALAHASGIHATVAGVVFGFMDPVIATSRARVKVGSDSEGK